MKKLREEFTVYKNKDGDFFRVNDKEGTLEEVKLAVRKPNHEQQRDANFIYSKYMTQYLKAGILPQIKLEETIKETGVWGDEKEKKERELVKTIIDVESKLKKGGIKQSEASSLAKDGIKARSELFMLSAAKQNILNNSAENLAQNHRFNYLVSECTVYSNGDKRYFKTYDDFLKEDNLGNAVTYIAGEQFAKLIYGLENDYRRDWPEYKFLKKYNFVNDKLEFVDKEGNLVDIDGKQVDLLGKEELVEVQDKEPEFLPD